MNTISFIVLAFLIAGQFEHQQFVLQHVRSFFYPEEAFSLIHKAAETLLLEQRIINMLTVSDALITDTNSEALAKRIKVFRAYFVSTGDLSKQSTDDEVKHQITLLIAQITSSLNYAENLELAVKKLTVDYVAEAKRRVLEQYKIKTKEAPSEDYSEEIAQKLKDLDHYLNTSTWELYLIDFDALEKEPEEVPLLSFKGEGMFFRGNLYLVSGFAGAMKSFLVLVLAASAMNRGSGADRTLSFSSISAPIKVLYIDTELARNTVKKRWRSFKAMTGGNVDFSMFKYLGLRQVNGSLETKMQLVDEACYQFKPDLIILDSGRDLCHDFNDNREADSFVDHLKYLATRLNSVIISTSHRALAAGNAKGHFGMRLNEAAGLELSLTKKTDTIQGVTYISVEYPKQRDGEYEPFCFTMNPEKGWPVEYAPTVDHTEQRRQMSRAETALRNALTAGKTYRYTELLQRLMDISKVSSTTAKKYIKDSVGFVLIKDDEGAYHLSDPEMAIPFEDDLPPC